MVSFKIFVERVFGVPVDAKVTRISAKRRRVEVEIWSQFGHWTERLSFDSLCHPGWHPDGERGITVEAALRYSNQLA